ncbi:hypothetical protein BDV3_000787 [Batrachochytrium dendrobatidis]|uniref:Uncharacterized protein n=1 Tax=Batrachochytrium dendrobatidis (strain JEL423) TaxID=403673 RepID=A0A177W8S4_BATDL|nr:3'-5'-exoribonuclease [Batrachochytrium dendrobatidis]KAK5671866.1 3'-5'-exoribonuclease [Batrachochytrium dendrobatidis]OAJ36135.1 hypothetical protein BDEG_20341 [Batrachochytrium dendrobatidis JEL423]
MDRKRINGPEKSIVPQPLISTALGHPHTGQRADKRRPDQIRPIYTKAGTIPQANGSAYIETGNLKVICAVYGPRQSSSRQLSSSTGTLQCDFKFAPFSGEKRKGYVKDDQEKEFSMVLEQALTPSIRLENYPKFTIQVFVIVLENDGSMSALAAAISCASLALANAGIEMLDMVAASSIAYFGESMLCLDVSLKEEMVQDGAMLVSYMPSLNEVTHLIQTGLATTSQCTKAIELGVDACSQIHTILQEALLSE